MNINIQIFFLQTHWSQFRCVILYVDKYRVSHKEIFKKLRCVLIVPVNHKKQRSQACDKYCNPNWLEVIRTVFVLLHLYNFIEKCTSYCIFHFTKFLYIIFNIKYNNMKYNAIVVENMMKFQDGWQMLWYLFWIFISLKHSKNVFSSYSLFSGTWFIYIHVFLLTLKHFTQLIKIKSCYTYPL